MKYGISGASKETEPLICEYPSLERLRLLFLSHDEADAANCESSNRRWFWYAVCRWLRIAICRWLWVAVDWLRITLVRRWVTFDRGWITEAAFVLI